MKSSSHKYLITLAVACAAISVGTLPAAATEAKIPGSYLGAGVSLQGFATNPSQLGANITGRLKFENTPISLRSSVLFGNGGTSVVPTISYDLPVGDRTNIYLGAGGAFKVGGDNTLTGDRNSFALQPGVEVSLSRRVLLYGNAVVPINGYTIGSAGTSLQGGVGLQF